MPKLQISLPDGTEPSHELTDEIITIGRLPDNSIQIDDASVSSHHAKLSRSGDHYQLTDLDSTNGTRVNGERISDVQLQDGDRIRFGKIEAHYNPQASTENLPLPAGEEPHAVPASSSHRPADFTNASPFQTKKNKKDPVGVAIMSFAAVAVIAFLVAIASIFSLQPPQ
jgi:pSer/pThr/pTyr-binding forkhead associated (FHA) protein